ncbi:glycosyltransferase [Sporolactobacillus kofuensis]|uniref:Glycosyltransferase n=1 Tax=Sporolactobacillus kofuensis TaxID=269672 RepID=A0ABW1WJ37_9BACL|nr:glycosyltransferase [Sporolactobacillus kofuensis]MCO7177100.1 glycosyltransferase [Sporolactobacillus kofuensis]
MSGKEKLRVIHVLNCLLPSGAEMMLYDSADLWKDYEKYVLATFQNRGEFADKLETVGYSAVHIYNRSKIKKFIKTFIYFNKMEFDVIHIHREGNSYLYALTAKLACPKAKIIRTVHNVFKYNRFERKKYIFTRWLERKLGVKYIAIGESVYKNELNLLKNPCKIINNWCDESRFNFIDPLRHAYAREKLKINNDIFCIVSVGNCSNIKNHKLIIEALGTLNKKRIHKFVYYHIGQGSITEDEVELSNEYGLNGQILFLGRVQPDLYLEACDLFVMPSLYEGVSIAALEALRSGIPALFTDVPGLRDFKDCVLEETEIHYSNIELNPFVKKLNELYIKFSQGDLINKKTQSRQISSKYNMKKSVREYLEVYK